MENKIQLIHPAGKKAVSMDMKKYDTLKHVILESLENNGETSHTDLLKSITDTFKKNKTNFQGSLEWHMEWVKLDLEARKLIKRIEDKSPVKYILA